MNKSCKILIGLIFFILLFFLLLSLIKIQQIYPGNLYLKEYIDNDGNIAWDLFLLSDKKLNISLIDYIILETAQGEMFVKASDLELNDVLIKINISNIKSVKLPKNNVLIYGQKITLLHYFISNIFRLK